MLYESFFASAKDGFRHHLSTASSLRRGKAQLKAYLASVGHIDYGLLPFNSDVIEVILVALKAGDGVFT